MPRMPHKRKLSQSLPLPTMQENDAMIGQTLWLNSTGKGLEPLAQQGKRKLNAIARADKQEAATADQTDHSFAPNDANKTSTPRPHLRTIEEQNAITGKIFWSESTGKDTLPLANQVEVRERLAKSAKDRQARLKALSQANQTGEQSSDDGQKRVRLRTLAVPQAQLQGTAYTTGQIRKDTVPEAPKSHSNETYQDFVERIENGAKKKPTGPLYLKQAELDRILAEQLEYTLTQPPDLKDADTDLRNADTLLHSKGLVDREFEVPGYGTAKGGEINYIGVGMMMAHYGVPFPAVPALTAGWNGYQVLKGEGLHNYNQIFKGSFWAGYGYDYYKRHRKGN